MCNNRSAADVNEILTAKYLNNNNFTCNESQQKYEQSIERIQKDKFDEMDAKARLFADYIQENYTGFSKAHWVGCNGSLSRFINQDITDKEAPADVLLEYDTQIFGVSLKTSTKSRNNSLGDYSFQNLCALYCLDDIQEYHTQSMYEGVHNLLPQTKDLSLKQRHYFLKREATKEEKKTNDDFATHVIEKVRDSFIDKMTWYIQNVEHAMTQHLKDFYLNEVGYNKLRYIQLEAHGTDDYKLFVDQIKPRIDLLSNGDITLEKSGSTGIGIRACNDAVFKINFKYKDCKLTGTPVIQTSKWNERK